MDANIRVDYRISPLRHSPWIVSSINHLPGELLVFQLGSQNNCAEDLPGRRMALLAKGSSPVVVLEGTPPPAPLPGDPLPVIKWENMMRRIPPAMRKL